MGTKSSNPRKKYGKGTNYSKSKSKKGDPSSVFNNDEVGFTSKSRGSNNKGYNDVSWYTRNADAAEAATRISMNIPSGTMVHRSTPRSSESLKTQAIPSVWAFRTVPTVGNGSIVSSKSDAINMAAVKVYSKIRKQNTGTSSYDQITMMEFFMAMDSIYSAYAYFVRIYKTLRLYDANNRNYPTTLLASYGVSESEANELRANLADFYFWLISAQEQINMWNVPGDMDVIKRHYWLYSNVYKDSDSSRAANYVFTPFNGFHQWNEDTWPDADYGFGLVLKSLPSNMTLDSMKQYLNDLLFPLYRSQDFMTINGDVLKVYDKSQCFSVSHPMDNEIIEPVYNKEILMQINNAVICGEVSNGQINPTLHFERYGIYEDTTSFTLKQDIPASPYLINNYPILNFYHDTPTRDEILVATRFMPQVKYSYRNGVNIGEVATCGADIIVDSIIYNLQQATEGGNITISATTIPCSYIPSTEFDTSVYGPLIASFDYHPPIYIMDATLANNYKNINGNYSAFDSEDNVITIFYDFDNFVYLPPTVVEQLNTTCMFSLFGVY